MALKLNSSSGGSVTLQEPTTASNYTLTVPAQTATLAINGSAFSAYAVVANALSSSARTKVNFDTEIFDTNSCYDTSTSKFTPNVAGYYQINAAVTGSATTTGIMYVAIYKNGSAYKLGTYVQYSGSGTKANVSGLVYCNGSTDYIEIYVFVPSSMNTYTGDSTYTWFDGAMVRAA